MSATTTCPFCASTNIEEIKNYSKGLSVFAIRFYHDRKCEQCEAIWTPPTPLWGAWACVLTGVLLIVGFCSLCGLTVNEHWEIFIENPWEAKALFEDLGMLAPFASMLFFPGVGCVYFGIRGLLLSKGFSEKNNPPNSPPQNPLPTYEKVLFVDEVTNKHRGRPVGLHSLGVLAYDFPGRSDNIEIISYDEIDQLKVEQETRGQRILNSTWTTLVLLAYGAVGTFFAYCLFFDSDPKMPEGAILGIILVFVWAISGPLFLLMSPFYCIARSVSPLGVYLTFSVNRKRGKYYFEPEEWHKKRGVVVEILGQHQPNMVLPK